MKLALFASGTGSNVQAIVDSVKAGRLKAELACLVCDQPHAKVIEIAVREGLPYLVLTPKDCPSRENWEQQILDFLNQHKVDLVILAGFMRIIGQVILSAYPKQVINIHPSLLPAFAGRDGIKDAYKAQVKETGVTIHFVDEGIDTGEIIVQERVTVPSDWSLEQLEVAIHEIEHRLFPATIQTVIEKGTNEL